MPQQRKKEESERLRGERDQIKFIDLKKDRKNKEFNSIEAKIQFNHLIFVQSSLHL